MDLICFVCFGFIGLAAAGEERETEGCSYTLTEKSKTITLPKADAQAGELLSCSWKILSSNTELLQININRFLEDRDCDCNCGRVLIRQGNDMTPRIYCQKDLPAMLQSYEESLVVQFESTGNSVGSNKLTMPLFKYITKPRAHRSIRESGNENTTETKPDVSKGPYASKVPDNSKVPSNSSVVNAEKRTETKLSRLPIIIPATFTVLIFVACVACIAYKNYNIEEFPFNGSIPDITETNTRSCCPKNRKRSEKKHGKSELYDVMLKQYKAESNMKNPSRKSSTINVQGVNGSDPQSIARKHLILRHMREPPKSSGAVEALIKLSSKAFIASSMVQNQADPVNDPILEEDAILLDNAEEPISPNESLPMWQQEEIDSLSPSNVEDLSPGFQLTPDDKKSFLYPKESFSKKRNSGSSWFKYKRLEKQSIVDDESDEELKYDCAQHIQRILSASRENLEEARRILPDDVKDIVLPEDLEAALAEFELWPDSSV